MVKLETVEQVEMQYTGKEYKWNNIIVSKLTKSQFNENVRKSFNFYNYHNRNQVKKFVVDYLKELDSDINFSSVQEEYIPTPLAWYCRMITHCGFKPNKEIKSYIENTIIELVDKYKPTKKDKPVQSSETKEENSEIISEINFILGKFDAEMDQFIEGGCNTPFNFTSFIASNEVRPRQITVIKDHVQKMADEIEGALNATDKQLVEGYAHMSKPSKKRFLSFANAILETKSYEKKKKKQKPEKVKPVKPGKEAKTPKVIKSEEYKPVNIDGAKELWVFSKRYNIMIQFLAEPGKEIKLVGKTLQGVDRIQSTSKRIPSKIVDSVLNTVLKGKKEQLDKALTIGYHRSITTRFDASKPDQYKVVRMFK